MRKLIFISLLFISVISFGQGIPLGIIASSGSTSTTGEGKILWWQDFNSEALDANVSDAEAAALMGTYATQYGFGDGGDAILDNGPNGAGDHYFRGHMVNGPGGGGSGFQFIKSLRANEGEPLVGSSLLNNLKEIWQIILFRVENNFVPPGGYDGKFPGGLRGSTAFLDYVDNLPPNTKEDYVDGFLVRKYYHPSAPGYHFVLMYWIDMANDYGDSQPVWASDFPLTTGIAFDGDWHQQAIRLVLDGEDGFVEGYLDEKLVARTTDVQFNTDDSVMIDWSLMAWFANNSATVTYPWHVDIAYTGLIGFTDGDSTFTGSELGPDFINLPAWPPADDTTGWGQY